MPEGPEIRLAADRVARVLVDNEIVDVALELPEIRPFEPQLRGSRVTAVDTRGKAMLTRFDNGLTLFSHNQLYGRWYTTKRPRLPSTRRSLRVALHTPTHSALLYSASDIEVLTEDQLERHPFLARLGPDILDEELTSKHVADRHASPEFRNRSLGSLYLDQGFLAGNGNYLRSEILWAACVGPKQKPSDLDKAALKRLASTTLKIARRSYRTRGITATSTEVRKRAALGMTFQQYRFQVYGREGLPCYACETPIERITMSSRGLFLCPSCQDA